MFLAISFLSFPSLSFSLLRLALGLKMTNSLSSSNAKEIGIEMVTEVTAGKHTSDMKWEADTNNGSGDPEENGPSRGTNSTSTDAENMRRMGRDQELVRNFRLFSMASFAAMATAIWEFSLFQITPALVDGGRPSLIYSTIWNFIGFAPIYLSMAEMASMAPIAGAQYHWVSEFAPENLQKVLSYVSGYVFNSHHAFQHHILC